MSKVKEISERIYNVLNNNGLLDSEIVKDFVQRLQLDEVVAPDKSLNLDNWLLFCGAVNVVLGERKFEEELQSFLATQPIANLHLNLGKTKNQVVQATEFVLPTRFEVTRSVGMGQYGIVVAVNDHGLKKTEGEHEPEKTEENTVAIKRIENVFESLLTATRTLRELKLLRLLKGHDNIISLRTAFLSESMGTFSEVYLVTELVQHDLASILKRKDLKETLTIEHMQFLLYQMLRGLKYIHSAKVIHRDLKPRNLLVSHTWDLLICDFGLARRQLDDQIPDNMTCYICSRWYRAPEAICSWPCYTVKLDMWSVGCIWGEIISYGSILFQGQNSKDVLRLVCDKLGKPDAAWLEKVKNQRCVEYIAGLAEKPITAWSTLFDSNISAQAIQVLDSLCKWNPEDRASCEKVLADPFFVGTDEPTPEDEPEYTGPDLCTLDDFDFENYDLSDTDLRAEIFSEVLLHHPEARNELLLYTGLKNYDVRKVDRKLSEGDSPSNRFMNKSNKNHLVSGIIWKLNSDGNPKDANHWLQRKMWLTKSGGLFYYSKKDDAPIGRSLRELNVCEAKHPEKYAFPFVFQIIPTGFTGAVTTLAAFSEEERANWIKHLSHFKDDEETLVFRIDSYKTASERRTRNVFNFGQMSLPLGSIRSDAVMGDGEWSWRSPIPPAPRLGELPQRAKARAKPVSGRNRRNSQAAFAARDQTIMVFDWDDTLFPTFWIRDDLNLNWKLKIAWQLEEGPYREAIEKQLDLIFNSVSQLLRTASAHAKVVIVTLARAPWVEISGENFMPGINELLKELDIPVVYAQNAADPTKQIDYDKAEFKSAQQVENYWTNVKGAAIAKEAQRMYSKYEGQSWKNVISFGDSDFERQATQAAVRNYWAAQAGGEIPEGLTMEGVQDDHYKKVRVKTMKLLDEPTSEELLAQVNLMRMWLRHMVQYDSGIDIVLEGSDDNSQLEMFHKILTDSDVIPASLSWTCLGGLEEEEEEDNEHSDLESDGESGLSMDDD